MLRFLFGSDENAQDYKRVHMGSTGRTVQRLFRASTQTCHTYQTIGTTGQSSGLLAISLQFGSDTSLILVDRQPP